jgi:hypothetical protein
VDDPSARRRIRYGGALTISDAEIDLAVDILDACLATLRAAAPG